MIDPLLQRVPPQDIEVEEAIISALLISNKGFEDIEDLRPEDFYKGSHKKIYAAMLSMRKKNIPVDLMTLFTELNLTKELESVGGAGYISKISNSAPMAVNVGHYAKRVMDLSKAREMINSALSIAEQGFCVTDIEKYISDAQSKILDIQASTSKDKFFDMEPLMQATLDRIELAQSPDGEVGLSLGLGRLDSYMQVRGGKLILLAGRPGMGKSSLALSIALRLGYKQVGVGIMPIEMDNEQFSEKMLSVDADVNGMSFYVKNKINRQCFEKLKDSASSLASLPITMIDSGGDIEDVKRRCRKFKKMGKKIIIIDQLNQIYGEKGLKPYEVISKNCTSIKQIAKEIDIPIILLCQLSRKVEDRPGDNRPTLPDLADTGKLEQDADIILFLFREGYYKKQKGLNFVDPSITEIDLPKNRQGKKGTEYQVVFNEKRGMFILV